MSGARLLMEMNAAQADAFVRDKGKRIDWRAKWPVEVGVFECMDGRVNLPTMFTGIPVGVIQTWENAGGIFDLAKWIRFQNSVLKLYLCAKQNKRLMLYVVVSHFSRSNENLGCAAHKNDVKRAQDSSAALMAQFKDYFGADEDCYTIHVTVETDEDALILHGEDGAFLDLGLIKDASPDFLRGELRKLHPEMPPKMAAYLLDLLQRNLHHAAAVRQRKRPHEVVEHREWVMVVGKAPWITEPNTALTVGPFDPKIAHWINLGGRVLSKNILRPDFNKRRGLVLLASTQYSSPIEKRFAEDEACELAETGTRILQEFKDIPEYLRILTMTVNVADRRADVVAFRDHL